MSRHTAQLPPAVVAAASSSTRDESGDAADAQRPAQRQGPAGPRRKRSSGPAGEGRVNLRDVAKEADVSVATVSLVLNESERISAPTSEKVRGVMRRMGYRPNRLAQSLGGRYVKAIAAILPDLRSAFADAYYGQLLAGLLDAANERGFKVLLEQAKPDWTRAGGHVELFERRFVDGVLLLGHSDESLYARDFCEPGRPAVTVDGRIETVGCEKLDWVASDYKTGAVQAMNYLAQLGHREIGLIEAAPTVATVRDRVGAWRKKLVDLGVGDLDSRVGDGAFTQAGGADACEKIFAAHPGTTAIVGISDEMAVGAMRWLRRNGRRVPQDVSVLGFDDLPYASFVEPALTTVHLPLYDVGRRAVIRLIERIEGKRDSVREPIDTHLVIRDSTSIVRRD